MLQHWSLLCIAVVAPVVSCSVRFASTEESPFLIETKRESDQVDVRTNFDRSIISVRSPFGISHAVIQRKGEHWPAEMEVRLYLKGLENLRISSAVVTVNPAASVQQGELKLRVWKDDDEEHPLMAGSQYWTDIRIVESDDHSVPSIPLTRGCFAVSLPKALLTENPKSITLRWIDLEALTKPGQAPLPVIFSK